MSDTTDSRPGATSALVGKLLGGGLFLTLLLAETPEGMAPEAQRLAALVALMACLWMSQAIDIAATSLIPLVGFPLLGVASAAEVSKTYIDHNVMLFLGGFIIALGIEKWGLHRRMALHVVRVVGAGHRQVVLGFMLATALLSMWISNTASTLLMLPIAAAMLVSLREAGEGVDSEDDAPRGRRAHAELAVALMLGVAYSASLGGLATLVGTPTNVTFVGIWRELYPRAPELSAGEWMATWTPMSALFVLAAWAALTWRLRGGASVGRGFFRERLRRLGPPSRAEWTMLAVFLATALLWIFRRPLRIGPWTVAPGWSDGAAWLLGDWNVRADDLHDSTVAIGMAVLMFALPAGRDEHGAPRALMDWQTARRLPWGILLLIGGGFALADGFQRTGLADWIGDRFGAAVEHWPLWLLVGATCLLLTFLTELTSNVATVAALLPILANVAERTGVDPRMLMIPATIAASCAFMLPIATPPNAIVFGSGEVRMGQMARAGFLLNLFSVVLITLAAFWLLMPQLGIVPHQPPAWAERAPESPR